MGTIVALTQGIDALYPRIAAFDGGPTIPSVAIIATPQSITEGNSGSVTATFAVTRSGSTTYSATVDWAVSGNGANPVSASDFFGGVFPSGTLVFGPGETTATISVQIAGDTTSENNEGYKVTLTNPLGCILGNATGLGTITDDDSTIFVAGTLDATNTGACLGGTFPEYTGPWPLSGTIENYTFTNSISAYEPGPGESALLRNCIVHGSPYYVARVSDAHADTIDFQMEYCTIIGGDSSNPGTVNGVAGAWKRIHRCNIHNCENGINTWIDGQVITENWIHDFRDSGVATPHYDGIENNGCDDLEILRNKIELDQGDTGCIQNNNEFGSITNIKIEDNYLIGGGYPIYCDGMKDTANACGPIELNRNVIGPGYWQTHGGYGYIYDYHAAGQPGVVQGTGANANTYLP